MRLRSLALLVTLLAGSALAANQAPPPPSDPPVTRAEADELLRKLADAFVREDAPAVRALYTRDDDFAFKTARDVQRLFDSANRFQLVSRVDGEERLPDGGLALDVFSTLTCRPLGSLRPRIEKRRWRMIIARRPGEGIVVAAQPSGESGLLPKDPPWRNPSIAATVALDRLDDAAPSLGIDATLELVNGSAAPQSQVSFALHPFSSDLVAAVSGTTLATRRVEASIDAWFVKLSSPVPPGGSISLHLTYRLSQPGSVAASAIDKDVVRLYAASCWLPQAEPPRPGAALRAHDVVVTAPDGVVASMPGARTELPDENGAHASRFVSELPDVEIPLIALRGTLTTMRLGPKLVLDVVRTSASPEPERAVSYVTTLAAFLEDRLGPSPVTRIALAEAVDGGYREAPAFLAMDSLDVPKDDATRDPSVQAFLFTGLAMTRLWVLHAHQPTGVGADAIAAGLCSHLTGEWARATIDRRIPSDQRDLILSYVQLDPQLDRPLLPVVEDRSTPRYFKQDKARMVFDAYQELVGADAWHDVLLGWATQVPKGSPITALVDRMGGTPERDRFLDAFMRREGACQVHVTDQRVVELSPAEAKEKSLDPAAWKRYEIEVTNDGLGPVPLIAQVEIDQAVRRESVLVPEYGKAVVSIVAGNPASRIRLDPDHLLWQADSSDDDWPPVKTKKRDEFDGVRLGGKGDLSIEGKRQVPER